MQVIRGDGPCPTPLDPSVVTIGAYDGVHLGHQAVIRQVRELAAARGLQTVVVTFDRHPAMVVRPESAPSLPLILFAITARLPLTSHATNTKPTMLSAFGAS